MSDAQKTLGFETAGQITSPGVYSLFNCNTKQSTRVEAREFDGELKVRFNTHRPWHTVDKLLAPYIATKLGN